MVLLLLRVWITFLIFASDKNENPERMLTPNDNPLNSGIDSTVSDLALSSEYYQHKANECHDLINSLVDFGSLTDCTFTFSANGRPITDFRMGASDVALLRVTLHNFAEHYSRRAAETGAAYEQAKNTITGTT